MGMRNFLDLIQNIMFDFFSKVQPNGEQSQ